ncbi:MAG: hypothetical protein ABSE49_17650 [Polyangiaceae bacterium]|jgi:hypothetical protein
MGWSARAPAVRRLLGSASLGAAAVGVASLGVSDGHLDKPVLGVAALVGVAAVGLARRSVLAQVLARGIAWVVLTPMLYGLADTLGRGHLPDAHIAFFATTSAGALLLARPALHTEAARAEFSPVRYRRVFLAGAVASVMTSAVVALFAAEQLLWRAHGHGVALAAFAAMLLATAVGVVRMRAWGVLLGMVTSVAAFGAALFASNEYTAVGLALAAIPGLILASPLLAARLGDPARLRRASSAVALAPEVAREESLATPPPVFARVAADAEVEGHEVTALLARPAARRT